jgi:hypothetical protein
VHLPLLPPDESNGFTGEDTSDYTGYQEIELDARFELVTEKDVIEKVTDGDKYK